MNPILYNHADLREGVVKTRAWGTCESTTCPHADHDPRFRYLVTELYARSLWSGEMGEEILQSNETGRAWYTRYHANGRRAPHMVTIELDVVDGKPVLPADIASVLRARYVSPRHEVLLALAQVVTVPAQDVDPIANSVPRECLVP